ncbi:hypothetical protein M409DRAFT_17466 [Zasmidium cellare ATCC 36951]|uniref:Uncharacterized protein n=1 Tax=Zasmidium cellare ATCC 36951 TaxID=1080233 RepID=A0A6A6D1D1_ZASCE|nr:uncharacterized protein M409DRAFT_17466 [Zasmidium cellare ATCC 36951]KAF2172228.1 hypothetical protein M409DRAFT_17466 [Zasmidium cellare ATCC 36951]
MDLVALLTHFAFGIAVFLKFFGKPNRRRVSELAQDFGGRGRPVSCRDASTQTEDEDQQMPTTTDVSSTTQDTVPYETDPIDDKQALREQVYVNLQSATTEDFTGGPARLVAASDGVQDVAAILVTLDLAAQIQDAIEARRTYAKEESKALKQQSALSNLKSGVECEKLSHQCRIDQENEKGPDVDQETLDALQKEHDNLALLLEDIELRIEAVNAQVLTQAMVFRNCQTRLIDTLEETFIEGLAVDPESDEPESPIEELDLQQEYQAFLNPQQETDAEPQDIAPLDITPDDYFQATNDHLTASELAQYEIRDNYFAAREHLIEAQNRFDRREYDREMDRQTTQDSAEDFDVRWVHRFRELTTQLIEAEAAFTAAKVAANEASVDVGGEDQCSLFVDRDDDGYRESHDAACTASAPRDKIMQWVEGISDQANPEETSGDVEVDDWDAPGMDMSDSVSCVAIGSYRSKIDHWREETRL